MELAALQFTAAGSAQVEWSWGSVSAWSWVDPQKEMNAAILGLKNGILSLQDVASQYGKDVEELLAQIKRDKSLMEQFDVEYALEPYGATQIGIEPNITGGDDGEIQG